MAFTSPANLEALSAIVKDNLKDLTLVEFLDSEYYLALGRFQFYFIKKDLSSNRCTIMYGMLKKIITFDKPENVMQI